MRVAVGHLDRVAEQLDLGLGPELAEALDRQLALGAAGGVDLVLELVHRDLAEDRGDLALDRFGEQRRGASAGPSPLRAGGRTTSPRRTPKRSRRRSAACPGGRCPARGERRRGGRGRARGRGSARRGACRCSSASRRGGPTERLGAEGAAALVRAGRGVDPAAFEEPFDHFAGFGARGVEGRGRFRVPSSHSIFSSSTAIAAMRS